MLTNKNIRNISIIAHVDHGKSTLADRLIELSGLITRGDHNDQILDNMDLERERGITIKSQPIRLIFDDLIINLIDTPGHVDFSYEVSRALIACDGAILLVDGTKGVQAQTFAHSYAAIEAGLDIIPVINKIDSVDADIHNVSQQIHNLIGSNDEEIFNISAKTGKGVEDLINEIPNLITPPEEKSEKVNALIFDSYFDSYKGVVASVRVFGGEIKKEMNLKLVNSGFKFDTNELGYFDLNPKKSDNLKFGEVGYIVTGAKDLSQIRVGDTLVTGDSVKAGDQQKAKAVHEFESVRLLKQIQEFNQGIDPTFGQLADKNTNIFAGAAADPSCRNQKSLKIRTRKKKEAGAKFIQTQMVMDRNFLIEFCEEISKPLDLPVIAGVFLLKSYKNALFINKYVPGANIPEKILNRLKDSKDPLNEGILIAAEQAQDYLNIADGIHLMAVKAEYLIPEILKIADINQEY